MSLQKIAAPRVSQQEEVLFLRESEEFTMAVDPSMWQVIVRLLTDQYQHPVEATVRELVSNALDAVNLLPPEERRPVEIKLPTSFNPFFEVVDHGVGMSAQEVRTVYTQYGASQKGENFALLGAYGLGAKTPLAYGNSFLVVTTKDGVTTECTLSREVQENRARLLTSRATGAPSGTRVSVPVRLEDVEEFRAAVGKYMVFPGDLPLMVDGKEVPRQEGYVSLGEYVFDEETSTRGRLWMRLESFDVLPHNNLHALPVSYVLGGWPYEGLGSHRGSFFLLELKPGVVDFAASRDAITHNECLKALDEGVKDHLSTHRAALLQEALRSLRGAEARQAWDLLFRTTGVAPLLREGASLPLAVGKDQLPLKDLQDGDGKNPLLAFSSPDARLSFAFANLPSYRWGSGASSGARVFYTSDEGSLPPEGKRHLFYGTGTSTLKEVPSRLKKALQEEPSIPLGLMYAEGSLRLTRNTDGTIFLVTEATEASWAEYLKARIPLQEEAPQHHLFFTRAKKTAALEEVIAFTKGSVEVLTEAEWLKKLALLQAEVRRRREEERRKRRENTRERGVSKKDDATLLEGRLLHLSSGALAERYSRGPSSSTHLVERPKNLSRMPLNTFVQGTFTLEELKKAEVVIVAYPSSFQLFGPQVEVSLLKRGVDLSSRFLLTTDRLSARHATLLRDYPHLYLMQGPPSRAKAFQPLVDKGVLSPEDTIPPEAAGFTPQQVFLHGLMKGVHSTRFYREIPGGATPPFAGTPYAEEERRLMDYLKERQDLFSAKTHRLLNTFFAHLDLPEGLRSLLPPEEREEGRRLQAFLETLDEERSGNDYLMRRFLEAFLVGDLQDQEAREWFTGRLLRRMDERLKALQEQDAPSDLSPEA